MDNPTMKKALILDLATSLQMDSFKGNILVLFTAGGIISGTPLDNEKCESLLDKQFSEMSKKDAANEILYSLTKKSKSCYDKEFNVEHPLPGNDGYLTLIDATVNFGTCTISVPNINVFFDQIIGATVSPKIGS